MTNDEFLKSITLEGEIWKDVTGYEGYYMVSSLGKVISLGRSITNNLGTRYQQPHVVAPCAVSSGYIMVRLWKNNKEQKFYIHRLVAISFIPNEHEYPEVDHIDCDKLNNKISKPSILIKIRCNLLYNYLFSFVPFPSTEPAFETIGEPDNVFILVPVNTTITNRACLPVYPVDQIVIP